MNKDLKMTIESRIDQDSGLYDKLENYSNYYCFFEKKLFNDLANADKINNELRKYLKKRYIVEYHIHARLFNALYNEVKGKIDSLKELQKDNDKRLKKQYKQVEKKIKQRSKWIKQGWCP